MTSSDVWDEATAATYDDDVAERFDPEILEPTVALLAELAQGGPVLEFAVGTGRVGVAMLERGLAVSGIELSPAMLRQLRAKVDPDELPVVLGDMSSATVPGRFSLVYLVFNTISNLRTQDEQAACFRNAARHLVAGGRFVVELWVPPLRRLPPGQVAVPFDVTDSHLGFDTYDVATQACTSHHYWRDAEGAVRYSAGHFRYLWPSECDLMATLAGLEFEARYEDWRRTPFTHESEHHVSIWRKAPA